MRGEVLFRHMDHIRWATGRGGLSSFDVCRATHEAGHAIVALALDCPVSRVTIDAAAPMCEFRATKDAQRLTVYAAGHAAMGFLDGAIRLSAGHFDDDREQMRRLTDAEGRAELFAQASRLAGEVLRAHRNALDVVATALLTRTTLDADDLRALVPKLAAKVDRRSSTPLTRAASGSLSRSSAARSGSGRLEYSSAVPGLGRR